MPLQKFPNPNKDPERFGIWVSKIGGNLSSLDKTYVYHNRTVCRNHFEEVFHYPKGRLSTIAVPSLQLPGTFNTLLYYHIQRYA